MTNPTIADNKPIKVELAKGQEYYFCACGRSKSQPFCDGSHAGTGFTPKAFTADESGTAYLCACKHSQNQPFCDGSHKQFSKQQVGSEGPGLSVAASGGNKRSLPVATPTPEEPTVAFIHQLAREGLSKLGHHGPMTQALADADEDLRCLDDALEPVRSLIELAGPGLKPTVVRVATVLDREALVVQLTAPPRPDAPTEVPRAWTETGAYERPDFD